MVDELFRFSVEDEVIMLARLALAGLVGALIGAERRNSHRPAGIRTLALTSIGAAMFTLVSIHGFEGAGASADPARLAAQVATGVGFIGAGTIIRYGGSVRGLTTATAIWVAASLGVAAATGLYVLAVGGALLTFVVLEFFPRNPAVDSNGDAGDDERKLVSDGSALGQREADRGSGPGPLPGLSTDGYRRRRAAVVRRRLGYLRTWQRGRARGGAER